MTEKIVLKQLHLPVNLLPLLLQLLHLHSHSLSFTLLNPLNFKLEQPPHNHCVIPHPVFLLLHPVLHFLQIIFRNTCLPCILHPVMHKSQVDCCLLIWFVELFLVEKPLGDAFLVLAGEGVYGYGEFCHWRSFWWRGLGLQSLN